MISLEFAIRKMTSLPAQRVGLNERGLLRPGMFADITVFDPAAIIDNATFEEPQQLSTGVGYVLVNGKLVVDQGKVTPALPGRALRGPGYRARRYRITRQTMECGSRSEFSHALPDRDRRRIQRRNKSSALRATG